MTAIECTNKHQTEEMRVCSQYIKGHPMSIQIYMYMGHGTVSLTILMLRLC